MSQRLLERSLPHNIEAEKAILGAILVNNDQLDDATVFVRPDDFYHDGHRLIMRALVAVIGDGRIADLITVQETLSQAAQLEAAGGIAYIASLTDGMPYLTNVREYARMVQEKALMRAMISSANAMMVACFDGGESPAVVLDRAEQSMLVLAQRRSRNGLIPLQDLTESTTALLRRLSENREMITGVATGFTILDHMTSGFQPGDLVIIAARPAIGKSTIALNIGAHCAIRLHKPVAMFSLEMSKESLFMRLLCSESHVDAHKLRTGYVNHQEMEQLLVTMRDIAPSPFYIDDSSLQTVMEIRTAARTLHRQRPLGLIIVDYLQLISGGGKIENRTQEVSAISRALKALARELAVPVIALSQLSRSVETRSGDHRPILSDLRDSGSIEQDADTVIFIHRAEVYEPNEENAGLAELIVAKQRNGPIGLVKLAYIKHNQKFENLLDGY